MLAGKRHGMRAVGGKRGVDRLLVLVELNMACFIIKIQHRVQGVVIHGFLHYALRGEVVAKFIYSFSDTLSMSRCVPMSSKRAAVRRIFCAITSPAHPRYRQYVPGQ